MELDDPTAAQEPLLRVSALVPDESRLPATERLRLKAVRALVLRDVDQGVAAYRQLVAHDSGDAGAWLDLGRSQEAAGLQADARDSYEAAIARNQQYAAAWLQLGTVNARAARREESLSAFHHAEQLYHARSDIEGETQVLLARGNARAETEEARVAQTAAAAVYLDGARMEAPASRVESDRRPGSATLAGG